MGRVVLGLGLLGFAAYCWFWQDNLYATLIAGGLGALSVFGGATGTLMDRGRPDHGGDM